MVISHDVVTLLRIHYGYVWKQAIRLPLSSPSQLESRKTALTGIRTQDPDHDLDVRMTLWTARLWPRAKLNSYRNGQGKMWPVKEPLLSLPTCAGLWSETALRSSVVTACSSLYSQGSDLIVQSSEGNACNEREPRSKFNWYSFSYNAKLVQLRNYIDWW